MPKNVKKRTAKTAPAELPDWATGMPDEIVYYLEIYDPNDQALETVDVTRDEYIALKQHLAKMRGIVVPKVAA